jgi:tetratricopeptide (TPR) repeat protein
LFEYHLERGANLFRWRQYKEALAACDTALQIRPDRVEAHGERALALVQLKQYAAALQSFDRYLKDHDQVARLDIFRGRGQARMQLGDFRGAIADYTRVLQVQPNSDLYAHRGWAYYFADAGKLALDDFEDALRLNRANGLAYTGRGLARVMLGQYRLAVADAEEALRRQPDTPEMMHNIACTFAQAVGRVESDPTEPDRNTLAATYRRQALDAVRQTLSMVSLPQRGAFWRDKIVPDTALDPIRRDPEFRKLAEELAPASEDR